MRSGAKVHIAMNLEETLRRIERKLEKIEVEINEMRRQMLDNIVVDKNRLISLPDHLRKTVIGVMKVGQGTASDICRYTNRARAVESNYLNQLERQGFLKSFRKGRRKIFLLEKSFRESGLKKQ